MKRSEMLLKIQEILVEQHEDMTLEEAADDILTRLERAGMVPTKVVKTNSPGSYKTTTTYGWEPEDV